VTQNHDPAYEVSSDGQEEKQHIRADLQAVGVMSTLAFLPAVAFGGTLFTALSMPGWTYALLAFRRY
jgi:hypothetical protein